MSIYPFGLWLFNDRTYEYEAAIPDEVEDAQLLLAGAHLVQTLIFSFKCINLQLSDC